ncbi:MAG: thioredoxin domain-containing protein [Anaerolineaceae bacterium]|nr:thioredoxin domain-containing protein [Anaerolineaceae bacterium]
MPNHLIHETSPYLLQHAHNPVDWHPWGPQALEKAQQEQKPIFLSIGYAACHWCHVMEHESFSDTETAAILNEHFVSIKVDREERPDLDGIYMNAVVTMTGQGGWPMSVFLTPNGEPFYGGTYFPPVRRHGMPAFREVLLSAARAWENDRAEIVRAGQSLAEHIASLTRWNTDPAHTLRPGLLEQLTQSLLGSYDWTQGGWGRAPRFPQPMSIEYLLLRSARGEKRALDAANHNLRIMSRGGMYDVVGGGFHRYSTDDRWLAPHFEKMLYDNAQLARAYLHAYQLTGNVDFRDTCTETLDFILRELTDPLGGFYSSLDADSEGHEGLFYIWSPEDLAEVLAPLGLLERFQQVYDLPQGGNFGPRFILQRRADLPDLASALDLNPDTLRQELRSAHLALLQARSVRPRPATDDKVLVSWNALALVTFAEAARALHRPDYLAAAQKNAAFLLSALHPTDRLLRSWRAGQAHLDAYLEDYAGLILGLLALYQSDPDPRWYSAALSLMDEMQAGYADPAGGFFDTRADAAPLISRPKDYQDNATPSGNALAAQAMLLLAEYSGSADLRERAESALAALQEAFVRHPTAFGQWLAAAHLALEPVRQVALVGNPADPALQKLVDVLWSTYRPNLVAAISAFPPSLSAPALLADRPPRYGNATAYVCQGFVCLQPISTPEELAAQLAT